MSQRPRQLNAWKHGAHSNLGVLPNEDPTEFDDFHQSLIEEWQPSGSTEDDTVFDLAKCMWRKSRLSVYRLAEAARKEARPDCIDWSMYERAANGRSLNPVIEAKIQKVVDEMEAERNKHRQEEDRLREVEQVTPDALLQELKLDSLLDAKIDRLIKRLLHLKAAKEMIRAAAPPVADTPVRASTRSFPRRYRG